LELLGFGRLHAVANGMLTVPSPLKTLAITEKWLLGMY
jgi:hypothetical protein